MLITTSATAATRQSFMANSPKDDFLVQVPVTSLAGIRIISGRPIVIDGVSTADTTGMTVAVTGSLILPGSRQVWLIGTDTDATAATFEIMAFETERR